MKNPIIIKKKFVLSNMKKNCSKDLAEGKIDIIIGTHRILSSDIKFKNLQLLIIDDEQRFGVKQKEKLEYERERLKKGRTTTYAILVFEQDYSMAQLNSIRIQAEIVSIVAQMKTFAKDRGQA